MKPFLPPLPFPQSYWVVPGKLMAGEYPGSLLPEQAEQRLTAMVHCGIRHVINLMEDNEVNHDGLPFIPYIGRMRELVAERGEQVGWARYAIRDGGIPTCWLMVQILDEIDQAIAAGRPVYVHCWGGKGRTGTVVGCYLMRNRLAAPETVLDCITRLRENIRPRQASPETEEQCAFVRLWREAA